jgi:hypothetical protein
MQRESKMKRLIFAATAMVLAASGAHATTLVNGDFEANNTGFGSDYGYLPPSHNILYPEGKYTVDTDAFHVHDQWASFGDHTTGSGLMMIINGSTAEGSPKVWFEDGIDVAQNTIYYFSTWVASTYPVSPAQLDFSINGQAVGSLTASTTTGLWQKFYGTWNSGAATTADLALVNTNKEPFGNDFVLDDIGFGTTRPGVPEPAVWTMMIMGFGAAGAMLRRQRQAAALA